MLSLEYRHTEGTLDFATPDDRAESFNDRDEEIALAKLDWQPNQRFELFAKFYWHDWDSTYTRIDNDLANPGETIVVSDREIWRFSDRGANLLGEIHLREDVSLLVGYDYQRCDGRDDVFLIGPQAEGVSALFSDLRFDFDVAPFSLALIQLML